MYFKKNICTTFKQTSRGLNQEALRIRLNKESLHLSIDHPFFSVLFLHQNTTILSIDMLIQRF
jgi:hypothetical protein